MTGLLTVLGGSSPFTAGLVETLVAEPSMIPLRLVLHGRDEAALRAMRSYAAHRLGPSCAVTATTELQRALTGASIVVHQIRYGGLRGRADDAALATYAGVAADETLGPGGLAAAMRTFPAAFETGRAIVACSPGAWVVNLTNPLGPAVAALRAAGVERVVGVCDLPERTAALALARASASKRDETWCYAGFNHRGFVYAIGCLEALLAEIGDDGWFEGIAAATIRRLDAIPVKHMALILEGAAGERPDRAARLALLRRRLRRELAEHPSQRPAALGERRMPWYGDGVVPVLRALADPAGRRVVATLATADDVPRERPLWLDQRRDGACPAAAAGGRRQPAATLGGPRARHHRGGDVPQPREREHGPAAGPAPARPCCGTAPRPARAVGRGSGGVSPAPRVGIFGCGRMGAVRADACRALDAHLVFVQDTDEAAAARLAAQHPDCRVLEHVAAVDWGLVDAVFVCTPPAARGPAELAAIAAGVPVFMEKPLGLSTEHAQATARALRQTPVRTSVGYQNRYRSSVRRLRAMLSETAPYALAAQWVVGAYRKPWWLDPAQSGGPINEQATHVVDLFRHLAGEIVEVTAIAREGAGNAGAADTAAIALRFAGGGCASLLYSYLAGEKHVALEVFWPNGHTRLEGWDFHDAGVAAAGDPNAIFVTETAAFLGVGRDPEILCDFEDALRTQQAMDAIGRAMARTA